MDTTDNGKVRRKRSRQKIAKPAQATQRVELASFSERTLDAVTDQARRLGEMAKDRPGMATLVGVAGGMGLGLVLGLTMGARLLRH